MLAIENVRRRSRAFQTPLSTPAHTRQPATCRSVAQPSSPSGFSARSVRKLLNGRHTARTIQDQPCWLEVGRVCTSIPPVGECCVGIRTHERDFDPSSYNNFRPRVHHRPFVGGFDRAIDYPPSPEEDHTNHIVMRAFTSSCGCMILQPGWCTELHTDAQPLAADCICKNPARTIRIFPILCQAASENTFIRLRPLRQQQIRMNLACLQ
mmetsp:Transcript_11967/g.35941  ORF Transcript_11967/g.35941 Transcript_11967/m.35941 type:complete len:209 (+) Transcript_11967:3674-4300(+)